jgi:hypothetical protein
MPQAIKRPFGRKKGSEAEAKKNWPLEPEFFLAYAPDPVFRAAAREFAAVTMVQSSVTSE